MTAEYIYFLENRKELRNQIKHFRILIIIIPPLRHFTILGQKNAQNMLRYYTVELRAKIRTEEERQNRATQNDTMQDGFQKLKAKILENGGMVE